MQPPNPRRDLHPPSRTVAWRTRTSTKRPAGRVTRAPQGRAAGRLRRHARARGGGGEPRVDTSAMPSANGDPARRVVRGRRHELARGPRRLEKRSRLGTVRGRAMAEVITKALKEFRGASAGRGRDHGARALGGIRRGPVSPEPIGRQDAVEASAPRAPAQGRADARRSAPQARPRAARHRDQRGRSANEGAAQLPVPGQRELEEDGKIASDGQRRFVHAT